MKELFERKFQIKIPETSSNLYKIHCVNSEKHTGGNDSDPSLVLYLNTGKFKCFGCGYKGTVKECDDEPIVIDEQRVIDFHKALLDDLNLVAWFEKTKGINRKTIEKYKIGHDGSRYTFPIRNENGECINLHLYSAKGESPKFKTFAIGGGIHWFPFPPDEDIETVFLMEGDTDTLLARQLGLPAFCQTCGASSWAPKLTPSLSSKKVYILYDTDKAGKNGAKTVIDSVKFVAKEVKNIRLPTREKSKDFSDWILKDNGTISDLKTLVEETAPYIATKGLVTNSADVIPLKLIQTGQAKYSNKLFISKVQVNGKGMSPYLIPQKFLIECSRPTSDSKFCMACPNSSMRREYEIEQTCQSIIQFVSTDEKNKNIKLKSSARIPENCRCVTSIEISEYRNVERLTLCPHKTTIEADAWGIDASTVERRGYFLGSGIQTNSPYEIIAVAVPDPRDQAVSIVVIEANPLDDIECEYVDFNRLEVFRVEPKQTG